MSQDTKAGAPPSYVRPHCRMSWTHFMLTLISSTLPPEERPLSVTTADVRKLLLRVNTHEAAGPNNMTGLELKTCADQLADVITTFLISDSHRRLFAPASIQPSSVLYLKSLLCLVLHPILMKYFEKLVLQHIKDNIPVSLAIHQHTFRTNRSTEDAKSTALHSVWTHLANKSSYIKFSTAFNTISSMKLIWKLNTLGWSTTLCNWILDFLKSRPQTVRIDRDICYTLVLNTRAPMAVCSAPCCSHCTPITVIPDIRRSMKMIHHQRPWYKQQWKFKWGEIHQSCRLLHRKQSNAQHQQHKRADCWFNEKRRHFYSFQG